MRYSHRTGDVKRKSRGQLCRGPTPSIAQRTRACPAGRGRDLIRAVALGVAPSRRTVTDVMSSSRTSAELERLPPRFLGVAQSTGSERPRSIPAIGRRIRTEKKFCHRLCPWAPPVAELSPSRLRFRPPIALTFAFRLRPSRSASTYSRPVLDAGRRLRPARASFKGGQVRMMRKFSLFATFSFFHISTAIRATCG